MIRILSPLKAFVFLFATLFLAGLSNAQTFGVQYTGSGFVHPPVQYISDSLVRGPINYDVEDSFAVITNLTGSPINIDVIRMENNMPTGWSSTMCLDVCYDPFTDSASVTIPKGGSQYILMHFYTFFATSSSGSIKMKVKNADNPGEYSIVNFSVLSDPALNGIAEHVHMISVKAFPNPFTSSTTINLKNYRATRGSFPLEFTLYDLLGNAVLRKNGIMGDQVVVNRGSLHSGIYFYKITNAGRDEAFGRLSIQ